MLTVVSRVFFYGDNAGLLLRNLAENLHKYEANFLWCKFPTNLRGFIFCEAYYSYQFCYLIKINAPVVFSVKRELIARRRMKKEPTIYVTYFYKYCAPLDICR